MIWKEIRSLIKRNALFVINHSGGKDSQAMYIRMRRIIPEGRLILIHADLGRVEWHGCLDHIKATTAGESIFVVRNKNKDFIQMVKHRKMFPSPEYRQCTSDLKRGPSNTRVRQYSKENGELLIVDCMGIRGAESVARSKAKPFKKNERNSVAGREWYDLLPIFSMSTERVFETIRKAGQEPHWAYAAGMRRLSCCFCIMATPEDLRTAAKLNPGLYAEYVELEKEIGHTMNMKGIPLEEITGIKI